VPHLSHLGVRDNSSNITRGRFTDHEHYHRCFQSIGKLFFVPIALSSCSLLPKCKRRHPPFVTPQGYPYNCFLMVSRSDMTAIEDVGKQADARLPKLSSFMKALHLRKVTCKYGNWLHSWIRATPTIQYGPRAALSSKADRKIDRGEGSDGEAH
jgi:hypothetical protein